MKPVLTEIGTTGNAKATPNDDHAQYCLIRMLGYM
jgi:hypothetical protein